MNASGLFRRGLRSLGPGLLRLLLGGSAHVYALGFGLLSLVVQVFLPHATTVSVLKWLTLALLSYAAVLLSLHLDWWVVLSGALHPRITLDRDTLLTVMAVFGTTISP